MPLKNNRRVAFIVGPTAVGKTDLSIEIAQELNAEVISADSRYLYKKMDIGTAKPHQSEMKRIPHHLIDIAEIQENWSLAQYKKKTIETMEDIFSRGKFPLIVGGSGQYIRALIEGWDIPEKAPNLEMRDVLTGWAEKIGKEAIYNKLEIIDPDAAGYIDYRNLRRTIRALEVIFHTGYKFSTQRDSKPLDFSYKIAGLARPREELYKRIDQRIEKMMASGFIEEVSELLEDGYTLNNPPMSAIGYKEVTLFLKGEISLEECILAMKRKTRQFVRRQANWFKDTDDRIKWFDATVDCKREITLFLKEDDGWQI